MPAELAVEAPESDLSLLRRFTETGDNAIFAEIVRRYAGVVFSASQRILNDEARAQDVAQETFFRLMRQPKLVTHSLGGWLHRSATHLAIDAKRSELARRQREKTYWLNKENEARSAEPKWEDVSPYVDQALIELPEPNRTLLVRHFLQGTPQAELAAEMNTSAATISRKIKAGVEELQKLLKKKGIYVAMIALADFCMRETAKAAPAKMLAELGKMQMVGPVSVAPGAAAAAGNLPVLWPSTLKVPVKAAADSTFKVVASCIGGAGVLVVFGVIVMAWSGHGPAIPSSAPPVTTESPAEATMDKPRLVVLSTSPADRVHAFERTSAIGKDVTVTFNDTTSQRLTWSGAHALILKQTGKSIEQLERESASR